MEGVEQPESERKIAPRHSGADIFATILWVAAVAFATFCFLTASGGMGLWPWGAILGVTAAAWLSACIHELGHAAATVLCGWRVVVFAAGPFGIHFANRDFAHIRRNRRAEVGGFVVPVPLSDSVWTKGREAWIDASGSIANFLVGGLLIAAIASRPSTFPENGAGAVFFGIAILCFAMGLAALLPKRGYPSDGQNLVSLLRRDEAAWRKVRAIGLLYGLVNYQLRLRELPQWMVAEALQIQHEERALRQITDALEISIALDSRPVAITHTRMLIDEFRERYGENGWLNSCDAYFTAVWEADAKKARSLLWRESIEEELRALALAAEAAVCAAEGNIDAAHALLAQMHEASKKASIFEDLTFRDIGYQVEEVIERHRRTEAAQR